MDSGKKLLADLPAYFTTRDGFPLVVRLIRLDDAPRLIRLFESLSSETRRRRFHADMDHLSDEVKTAHARRFAGVDNRAEAGAIVAVEQLATGASDVADEHVVGVARLSRLPTSGAVRQAEAAIVVRDDYQGRGVGAELLARLVSLARHMNFHEMIADIESDNLSAIRLFRKLDLPTTAHTSQAQTILTFNLL